MSQLLQRQQKVTAQVCNATHSWKVLACTCTLCFAEESTSAASTVKAIPFIVRADSAGAIAVVEEVLNRVPTATQEVTARVVGGGGGGTGPVTEVNETDVRLAMDTGACVVVYGGVRVPERVKKLADKGRVPIVSGRVIYDIVEGVCGVLAQHMHAVEVEEPVGTCEVLRVFDISGGKVRVAGCVVKEGTFARSNSHTYTVTRDGSRLHVLLDWLRCNTAKTK